MTQVLGILGTGLIGASIGMRARECAMTVLGSDRSEEALGIALERGALDAALPPEDVLARADVLVLALPVSECVRVLQSLAGRELQARLLLDVASVKAPIREASAGVAHFVGTHPMAGSERSGPVVARPGLFADRPWAYVPSGSAQLDARAEAFIRSMSALPVAVDAFRHDTIVAYTSHLPQVFASLFSYELARRQDEIAMQLCGPAARELARLSRSSFLLWKDILEANGANIATELRAMASALETTATALEHRDFTEIEKAFEQR